ncbi:MAG: hypothetical protein K1W13_00435 [Lachnospiraceae bacterium]
MNIEGLFDEVYEGFCYQNCLREILRYYKIPNYDFYINKSMSTAMKIDKSGMYTIGYDDDAYGIISSCSDFVLRQDDLRESEQVLEEHLDYVKEDIPIVNCIDGFYLHYFPNNGKQHCRHSLLLIGEKTIENSVTVLDWYTPHFYRGEVKKEDYLLARGSENQKDGSIYSGEAIMNNWAIVQKEGWNKSISELAFETVDLSLKQYYEAQSDDANKYGIEVYRYLLKKFDELLKSNILERKNEIKYMYQEMYGSVKRKVFFLHFLDMLSNEFHSNEKIVTVREHMTVLVNSWNQYINMLLKSSFRGRDRDIEMLKSMLMENIASEEALGDEIALVRNSL